MFWRNCIKNILLSFKRNLQEEDNLSTKDKSEIPKVSLLQRFHSKRLLTIYRSCSEEKVPQTPWGIGAYGERWSLPWWRESVKAVFRQYVCIMQTAWPQIEYGHIFGYFIRRPGVYSQQELLDWKSLQAYNFFQSGFVQTVLIWTVNSSLGVVTAKVNPSMKPPNMAYELWIAV